MAQPRPGRLINAAGVTAVLLGLLLIGAGIYLVSAAPEAISTTLKLLPDSQPESIGWRTLHTHGLRYLLLSRNGTLGGSAIAQGWPLLVIGLGIMRRSKLARIFALVFAGLTLIEGLAFLVSATQSNRFVLIGLLLFAHAILCFAALLSKQAASEFPARLLPGTYEVPTPSSPQPRQAVLIVMTSLLFVSTATAATFATLFFAARPVQRIGRDQEPSAVPTGDKKAPLAATLCAFDRPHPRLATLHEVVLIGQVKAAAQTLREVDVDEPDEQGRTALMKVAAKGNVRMAMFLVAMGAQLNQRDHDGQTPLMYAVENGRDEIVEVFFGKGSALTEMAAFRAMYKDPLVPRTGSAGLKEVNGSRFEMPALNIDARDRLGQTALMKAMIKGHLEIAEVLYVKGSAVDFITDPQGNTMLHLLAAKGNWQAIRHFRLNAKNNPPCWCFYRNTTDVIFWRCCEPKQVNHAGQEPWMVAAEHGHLNIVQYLLPNPTLADLARKDRSGKTALDQAIANGHRDVAEHLREVHDNLTQKLEEDNARRNKK